MENPISPELETVLLELQIRLESSNMIPKPIKSISCSSLMKKLKELHDVVAQAIKNKEKWAMLPCFTGESSPWFSYHFDRSRDLYYQNVRLFKTQRSVDETIDKICQLLNTPQWNLGLLSTSKGLVYGPVSISLQNGETVDCSLQPGGTLIPQDLPRGASYESVAKFGLILEKDTAFQNLLSSGLEYPLNSCILITGKGYPDMNTRFLVRDLSAKLAIPMFALVDCDPHGIEIYFNYKYGSMAKAYINEQLAASHVLWLGIHPTDMIQLEPSILQPLTRDDVRKIKFLSERNYVKEDDNLRIQLESLALQERKCEIENITSISNRFLNDVYLPAKISTKKFI